jgi:tetratricopeptide (TPR) repeat protein
LIDEALRLRPRDPNLLILKWNGLSESERRASNGLQRLIDIQVGQLQDRIRIIEQDLSRFPIPNVELQLKRELLTRCIALARLICETDGDAQLALQLSKKAQTLDANNPEVHIAMAMSLRAAGQIPAAVTAQQQAVALRPQSERIIRLGKDLEKIAARSSQSQETIR